MKSLRIHVVLLSLVTLACTRPASQGDTQADVAAVTAVRDHEVTIVNAGAVDSIGAVYAADVVMMAPNEPAQSGLDAVRTWFTNALTQATFNARYLGGDVTIAGDWAIDRYTAVLTLTPRAGGAPVEEQIKGFHILRRQADGTWRITADIWNSDAPPPAAPPPAPTRK